jgi:hypothetical protein
VGEDSRSGENPEPTVTVRMEESKAVTDLRGRFSRVGCFAFCERLSFLCPDSGNVFY